MQPEPEASAPLFLPDELLRAYGDEARQRVQRSRPAPTPAAVRTPAPPAAPLPAAGPTPAAPPPPAAAPAAPTGGLDAPLVSLRQVLWVAAVGWAFLVLVWLWLAVRTGAVIWLAIAALGTGALALASAGLRDRTTPPRRPD